MAHISNPLATPEQLYQRHALSALPTDLGDVVLFATQCLTQAAGLLLQLPQSVTAQANVVLARYWLVESSTAHEPSVSSPRHSTNRHTSLSNPPSQDVSAAAIYLVAKLGPAPRSPRDVANVYAYLLSSQSSFFSSGAKTPSIPSDPSAYYLSDSAYHAFHSRVLALEARILYALSFDTHVSLPHPLAVTYLQALDFLGHHPKEAISRRVVEHLNAALLSPQMLYLTHQPNALAVSAIYNAARDVGAKMPECEWWEVFDVDREELGFLVVGMRSVEGWARKQREEMPDLWEGMLTLKMVNEELRKQGIQVSNGGRAADGAVDEEAEMMRKMDERIAAREGGESIT